MTAEPVDLSDHEGRADALELVLIEIERAWCAMKIPTELTHLVGGDKDAVTRAGRIIDQLDRTHTKLLDLAER